MSGRLLVMADGRSVHTERWCAYFESEGFETALFSLEPVTISCPAIIYQGKRPTNQGLIDYWLARKYFLQIVDEVKPDIISAHYVNSYGWLASHCETCPIVATAWGSDLLILPDKLSLHRRRIQKALDHAAYCTVDNKNLADAAKRFIPEEKIVRIVMGIDEAFFTNVQKTDYRKGGPIKILAPRGLQTVYDPMTIIKAVEKINTDYEFHITMLGKSPEADEINAKLKEMRLTDHIIVSGMMPHGEYIKTIGDFDIYLSASLSDSTSVALLEAMSVGLYPIVSDIPGNQEWISHEENGLLFEPKNSTALASVLDKAMAMPSFEAAARINRKIVKSDGIWQDNMGRISKLYLELMR
ncbi:MAG: glycosyltransferase [candidate division Zixibacteria bacterium]|nr:glycosyltransferase [candidate division Zixibacteria bacterium]